MALPPFDPGVNVIVSCPLPAVAARPVGAPGTDAEGAEAANIVVEEGEGPSVTFPRLAMSSVSIRLEAGLENDPEPPTRVV